MRGYVPVDKMPSPFLEKTAFFDTKLQLDYYDNRLLFDQFRRLNIVIVGHLGPLPGLTHILFL